METKNNDYHISFFKPATPRTKANKKMVLWLVFIWLVAVFGFQIALKIFEKPTPEPSFKTFEKVWANIENGNASKSELQDFAYVSLSVLGKAYIKPEHKAVLDNALSWSVYQLADEGQKESILNKVQNFEKLKNEIINITDQKYVNAKNSLSILISPLIGLHTNDVRTTILPFELISSEMESFQKKNKETMPQIMALYLIHNQSFLTDIKFLGFPFHYFYTAFFLLVLFIVLCFMYCIRADALYRKYKIAESTQIII